MLLYFFVFASVCFVGVNSSYPCISRNLSSTSIVCVCNSTYCDTIDAEIPTDGQLLTYTSSQRGLRFKGDVKLLNERERISGEGIIGISIKNTVTYQEIKGFGGALTDAASINAMSLSAKSRNNFIHSYFGESGIEYNIVRVPMASCDFSTRTYTYLDTPNDFNLTTFALAKEDLEYKIPLLKQILSTSRKHVSIYSSPWTAPAWMKSNSDVIGIGWLRGEAGDKYHKTWAEYFTRFFDEYKKRGIEFWGVTMQNEPSNGLLVPGKWQSMGWTPQAQRDFIKTDLGPLLAKKGYGHIKLMVHDDQRIFMPVWPEEILTDKDAAKFVSGIAVHWYWDWLVGPEVLNDTHNLFPDKFLLATEACNAAPAKKEFGSWESGEKYSSDVLDNLNNWSVGWVDWNMCLDTKGGPNWAQNFDDSPIIVNATADEFYKQPMYYHLGHFSKFIPEGSVRLHSDTDQQTNLNHVSILRKDGTTVLIVLNKEDVDVPIQVRSGSTQFQSIVPSRSIQTYLWMIK